MARQPAHFNLDERRFFVDRLEQSGAFAIKGAVEQVAAIIGVSTHTVYNDIKKARSLAGNRLAGQPALRQHDKTPTH